MRAKALSTSSRALLGVSAVIWGLGAVTAYAEQADTSSDLNAIVVTSTRLQVAGFDAPTPTTILNAGDLAKIAQPNIFDAVIMLPQLQGSTGVTYETGSTSTGLQGISALSLRGFSPLRTLTLLDGQRVVGSNYNGVVDVSLLPQMLVQRVDVVTGGASASWGSDAVAGVVNFVTDKKFNGFKADVSRGISTYNDDGTTTARLAFGTPFAGGRGHFEAATEYMNSAGVLASGDPANDYGTGPGIGGRNFNPQPQAFIAQRSIAGTPAGLPQYTYGTQAQNVQYAKYGLITAGPLQGIAFGAGGTPYQFQYAGGGTPSGLATGAVNGCVNPVCFGTATQPGDNSSFQQGSTLASSLVRSELYTRFSFDLTPTSEIYATINYGSANSDTKPTPSFFKNANLTIQCSNPYLPASIATACAANNITSFQYGIGYPFPNWEVVAVHHVQRRFVIGADGAFSLFGKDWTWDTYAEHGESDTDLHVRDMPLNARVNAAIDAVAGPNGTIVCRSAAAQASGCVPMNFIGNVPLTPGALAYVVPKNGPYDLTRQRQEAFSAAIHGSPFSDWAGPVSMAAGVDYREEYYRKNSDPYGNGVTAADPNTAGYPADPLLNTTSGNNWYAGNYHNGGGNYDVKEGFIETGIPLFNNSGLGKADLDLAGRIADYSTSGNATTWKLGATWDTPLDGLRFRALRSRDVRAPNLSELFAPNSVINAGVKNDFLPGAPSVSVQQVNKGNGDLKPERSTTTEFGVIFQPEWLSGFRASVDYYRIEVKDLIASLGIQNVVDLCFNGNQAYCASNVIVTQGGGPPQTTPFVQVVSQVFNLASTETDGVDIEAAYQFNLNKWGIPGAFTLRALANHVNKFVTNPGVVGQPSVDYAGALDNFSTSTNYNATGGTIPRWKADIVEDYSNDTWSVTLTERWLADGTFSNSYIQCTTNCPLPTVANPTINFNHMPGVFYVDFGASYNLSDRLALYAKVNNLANIPPPVAPTATGPSNGVNNTLYDVIGRMYYLGFRYRN